MSISLRNPISGFAILCTLVASLWLWPAAVRADRTFDQTWVSIDDGGGSLTLGQDGKWLLHGVIGQPDAATLTIDNRTLQGGFLATGRPGVTFLAAGGSVLESAGQVCIPLALGHGVPQGASAHYSVVGGTATGGGGTATGAGVDYTLLGSGTVTFAGGATSASVCLLLHDDTSNEPDAETVILQLSNPTNCMLGPQSIHTLTIRDHEIAAAPALLNFGEKDMTQGSTDPLSVTIQNVGDVSIQFVSSGISIQGDRADDFAFVSDPSTAPLSPGQSRVVSIRFNPSILGTHTASLVIETDDPAQPTLEAGLTGVGTRSTEPPPEGYYPCFNELAPTDLDPTVCTNITAATAFLYLGNPSHPTYPDPIQTGVDPDDIISWRASVIRGRVYGTDGSTSYGLERVTVSILDHPEFGETKVCEEGEFGMAVNGGGVLTVVYERDGYLPAQRQVEVPWNRFVWAPDVILINEADQSAATEIDPDEATEIQVAQGKVSPADDAGSRCAILLVDPGTDVTITVGGQPQTLDSPYTIRISEYTTGEYGPQAMPGELPPTVGYTYCVDFSIDEAQEAGATSVEFDKPMAFYLEDFLGLHAAVVQSEESVEKLQVPMGYYDETQSAWVPSPDGLVIKILDVNTTTSEAILDLNADNDRTSADETLETSLGIESAELQKIAALYPVGQALWRVPVSHFTSYDCNYGIRSNAPGPDMPPPAGDNQTENSCQVTGYGAVDIQNRVFHEALPIDGTPFALAYSSYRTRGYAGGRSLIIALTGSSISDDLLKVELNISVAGRQFHYDYDPEPNLVQKFVWDGKDPYNRTVQGETPALIEIVYANKTYYTLPLYLNASFGFPSRTPMPGNIESRYPARRSQWFSVALSGWDARNLEGLGGWNISARHVYNPLAKTLHLGDGRVRAVEPIETATFSFDADDYYSSTIVGPTDFSFGPDGNLYSTDSTRDTIYYYVIENGSFKRDQYGNPIAGDIAPSGVTLNNPSGMVLTSDWNFYVANLWKHQIVRVWNDEGTWKGEVIAGDPSGEMANYGHAEYNGEPAVDVRLRWPEHLVRTSDGTIYFIYQIPPLYGPTHKRIAKITSDGRIYNVTGATDLSGIAYKSRLLLDDQETLYCLHSHKVFRVEPNGSLVRIAGLASQSDPGLDIDNGDDIDGAKATDVRISAPSDFVFGPDGDMYVVGRQGQSVTANEDTFYYIYRINKKGRIYAEHVGPDTEGQYVRAIEASPGGDLYTSAAYNIRHYRFVSSLAGSTSRLHIPSEDGSLLYVFDRNGRHEETVESATLETMFAFDYDSSGYLSIIRDDDDNALLTVERNYENDPDQIALIARHGATTVLTLGEPETGADAGYLEAVIRSIDRTTSFDYHADALGPDGLLTTVTGPRGWDYVMDYDADGFLKKASDPEGGYHALSAESSFDTDEGIYERIVTVTTAEGRATSYTVTFKEDGTVVLLNSFPDGNTVQSILKTDDSTSIAYSDGRQVAATLQPDPRLGMSAPILNTLTEKLPYAAGYLTRTYAVSSEQSPTDPLHSVDSVTNTITINGTRMAVLNYDDSTRILSVTSPEGRETALQFDSQYRPSKAYVPGVSEDALAAVQYQYDAEDRVTTITTGSGGQARTLSFEYVTTGTQEGMFKAVTDSLGRRAEYRYDSAGRVDRVTLPDDREVYINYDASGNVTSITPPSRPDHIFTYDKVGNPVTYVAPEPESGAGTDVTLYEYNKDRELTGIIRPAFSQGQKITLRYGDAGCNCAGGKLSAIELPDSSEYTYTYTATGKLDTITSPDNEELDVDYNGVMPEKVAWSGTVDGNLHWTYDTEGRVKDIVVNKNETDEFGWTYSYDDDDLVTGLVDDNSDAFSVVRDADIGWITGMSLGAVADATTRTLFGEAAEYGAKYNSDNLLSVRYRRDAAGRITEKGETVLTDTVTTYSYEYDDAGRLDSVYRKIGSGSKTLMAEYAYDDNGNRTSYTNHGGGPLPSVGSAAVEVDDQDRLLRYGDWHFTYNANGEMLSKADGATTFTFSYDPLGTLTGATVATDTSTTTIAYVLDPTGRRIGKKVGGNLVQGFLYLDAINPVAELDGSNNVTSVFVYATKGHVPDYMVKPSGADAGTYRIVTDRLGSVRLVVDVDDGTVAQRLDYDEYGYVLTDTNPGFQPFGFAGGLYERETGLVRFGARDYDPSTGRWTTKDPIGLEGGLNFYGYVVNDPINLFDPFGLSETWWDGFKKGAYDGYIGWSNGFLHTISFGLVNNYSDPCNSGQRWGSGWGKVSGVAAQTAFFAAGTRAYSAYRSAHLPEQIYHHTTSGGFWGILRSGGQVGSVRPSSFALWGRGAYFTSLRSPGIIGRTYLGIGQTEAVIGFSESMAQGSVSWVAPFIYRTGTTSGIQGALIPAVYSSYQAVKPDK